MRRRAIAWAGRLYPGRWRQRYGTEFGALLEESDAGWVAMADVLRGALAMQMRSWSVWKFVAACGVIGAAVAGIASWKTPKVYESIAILRMDRDDSAMRERLGKMLQEVLSRNALSRLITTYGLDKAEPAQRPIEELVRDMRARTHVSLVAHPATLKVSYRGNSPAKAKQVAGLLVSQLIDNNFKTAVAAGHGAWGAGPLELLDPPTLPQRPRSPNRPMMMTVGILLGGLLGMVAFRVAVWSRGRC